MLTHIRLIDFKSFVDEQVDLAPLTLLVGANATGKSNLLDAVRLLSAVRRFNLGDALGGQGEASWPEIRGGIAEVARIGRDSFGIDAVWTTRPSSPSPASSESIEHQIRCRLPRS